VPTLVGAARGCERRCGASSAILLRRPARSGRPKAGSAGRSGADGSQWANILANLCGKGGGAQVRRRSRVGKALRKPLGFLLGWGVERLDAERTGSNWGRVVGDSSPSKEKEAKKSTGSLRREEVDGVQTNPSTQNINSEKSRLSAAEWLQPGAIPDGVHVLRRGW
jgi:hypothetical protein